MTATEPVLCATGVCVSLGGMPVLREASLSAAPGQMVALLGGNGSGKTTFVRALLGLIPHTHGSIAWFETPLAQFSQWSRIGYVPQRGTVHSANATVREVVTSGLLPHRKLFRPLGKTGKRAVDDALARVELSERAHWPLPKLSGGQQQRALIARALVGNPEVLVLDEPMAGIDLRTQNRLAGLFTELKADGLAMLVVLHEQGALADLIDGTVALHDGRVVPAVNSHHDHDHVTPRPAAPLGLANPLPEVL